MPTKVTRDGATGKRVVVNESAKRSSLMPLRLDHFANFPKCDVCVAFGLDQFLEFVSANWSAC